MYNSCDAKSSLNIALLVEGYDSKKTDLFLSRCAYAPTNQYKIDNEISFGTKEEYSEYVKHLAKFLPFKLSRTRELLAESMGFNSSNALLAAINHWQEQESDHSKIVFKVSHSITSVVANIKKKASENHGVDITDQSLIGLTKTGSYLYRSGIEGINSLMFNSDYALDAWREAHRNNSSEHADLILKRFEHKINTDVSYAAHLVLTNSEDTNSFNTCVTRLSYYDFRFLVDFILQSPNWEKFLGLAVNDQHTFNLISDLLICRIVMAKPTITKQLKSLNDKG